MQLNRPSPTELKAMRQQYSPPKGKITHWVVMHLGKAVYENASPALCEFYITNNALKGAYKKACYGR